MTKFKIQTKVILEILELIQASGRNVKGENKPFLNDCVINIEKEKLSINAIDENEVLIILIEAKLGKENVIEVGNLPVKLETAIQTLKRYTAGDTITISHEGDLIAFDRVKPKLKVKIPTIAVDSVKSTLEGHPFKYNAKEDCWFTDNGLKLDSTVVLNSSEFIEVVKDGEQIQHRSFPFTVKDKSVNVIVEDIDTGAQIQRELETKEVKAKQTVSSLYSYGFGNAFGNLTGEIKIWLGNEQPMVIQKKSEDFELIYVLTSSEQEEEQEEETEGTETETNVDDLVDQVEVEDEIPELTEEEMTEVEEALEENKKKETKKKVVTNGKKGK